MEILSGKKTAGKKAVLRGALIVLVCLFNLSVIAFLVWRQVQLERYSRETAPAPGKVVVAKLESESGKVVVRRKGALDYKAISEGEPLYNGDIVQTTENSKATLLFGKKTRLSLMSNSLLVIEAPPGNRTGEGAVLQIEKGSVSIESEAGVEGIAALKTPKSVINLNVRTTEFFFPKETKEGTSAAPRGAKAGLMHGIRYLKYLQEKYVPIREGEDDPELIRLSRALDAAESACAKGVADLCANLQDGAWKEISRLRGYSAGKEGVALTASVDESGTEKINVEQGMVKVETGTRLFAVTEGENIEFEPGKAVTRPAVSEEAREIVIAKEPVEVFFVEVESYYWE